MTEAEHRILLVDDDDAFRSVLAAELQRRGHQVEVAENGEAALARVRSPAIDVMLLDLQMPGMGGIEVLEELRALELQVGVVVLTGHGTIDTAIQAIRLGAEDYLEKPCPIEKVEITIRKLRKHRSLIARQAVLQDGYSPPDLSDQMIGSSAVMQQLREAIVRIGQANATTLVLGETGVGKDLVARMLHTQSPRRESPFVVVDCAALHEDLLQSELFGHEKGAFSGATRRKHGLFEVAHGGTLFLDEVGDTSPDIQAQLLRVLETGRFRRVGGTKEISVDVRVVSATNRNLEQAIAQGRFRQDLFFRLSTLTIEVPPLREREDDARLLAQHFLRRCNRRFQRDCGLGEDAHAQLLAHPWPGNVRELIHVIEQAVVLTEGDVIDRELMHRLSPPEPAPQTGANAHADTVPTLREVQYRHVQAVLASVDGNRAQAARILDISERNLYRLIKRISAAGADAES